jgi:hypothetical protein
MHDEKRNSIKNQKLGVVNNLPSQVLLSQSASSADAVSSFQLRLGRQSKFSLINSRLST